MSGRNHWSYVNDRDSASSCYSDSSNSLRTGAHRATQATCGSQRRIYFVGIPSRPSTAINAGDVAETPGRDSDGQKLFFGSVHIEDTNGIREIRPCTIGFGSTRRLEHGYLRASPHASFTLLPFDPMTMELVEARSGFMPYNRRAVEGGYNLQGNTLYHGVSFSRTRIFINGRERFLAIPGEVIAARPGVQVRMIAPFKL